MSKILIVAEHQNGKLNPATAKCVQCASQIQGAEIHVVVFAADPVTIANAAAQIAGVSEVITVANAAHEHPLAACIAPQMAELARGYTHVFGPSTTFGKDLMPRVAALLDAPQASDVMAVESATLFRRPIYAGNAIITVEVAAGTTLVATVRTASFDAAPAAATAAKISSASPTTAIPAHTRFVSVSAARSDRPDLQTAKKVVSGGRALGSADNFKILYQLADRMGAAVGASRAAVDAGYAPNDMQVGQTGKIIAPELYIAFGISGAIQHLTGIKDARTIVAINKDAEAPIFEVADYGLVGDLFEVVPAFEKLVAGQ
ncbi:MAG: electron transfer flavoprotein subunit alpha/FixB family protein [Steroidobacteraceae bacterium]